MSTKKKGPTIAVMLAMTVAARKLEHHSKLPELEDTLEEVRAYVAANKIGKKNASSLAVAIRRLEARRLLLIEFSHNHSIPDGRHRDAVALVALSVEIKTFLGLNLPVADRPSDHTDDFNSLRRIYDRHDTSGATVVDMPVGDTLQQQGIAPGGSPAMA